MSGSDRIQTSLWCLLLGMLLWMCLLCLIIGNPASGMNCLENTAKFSNLSKSLFFIKRDRSVWKFLMSGGVF